MSPPSISLCLSGGGYRAALFHLGAVRWLNDSGVLPRIGTLSCVSGGSILGAHLVTRLRPWPTEPLDSEEWVRRVETPFRNFVKHDIRTGPLLTRLLPQNWLRSWSTVEALRKRYETHLLDGKDEPLASLPEHPTAVFCATDMVFGVNWEATRERVGSWEAGYALPPPPQWTVARAVAASSCFPPVFAPARTALRPEEFNRKGGYEEPDRVKRIRDLRLTDGGVYDNLGLQPVLRDPAVLVSDGGGAMKFVALDLPWRRLARYPALLQNGIGKLRKSWLMQDYGRDETDPGRKVGTYWGIWDATEDGSPVQKPEIVRLIGGIRTDLNPFTDGEIEILINHGYAHAAGKVREKAPTLCPSPDAGSTPYPKWEDPEKVRRALRHSGKRVVPFREWRSRV